MVLIAMAIQVLRWLLPSLPSKPANEFPEAALTAFQKDPNAICYSLGSPANTSSGTTDAVSFHGYRVIGQVTVDSENDRAFLSRELSRASHGRGAEAVSIDLNKINPRYGIHAVDKSGSYDFLISFESGTAAVLGPSGMTIKVGIVSARDSLRPFLTKHRVPVQEP